MLLGNNCEMQQQRQVSRERAQQVSLTVCLLVCLSVCLLLSSVLFSHYNCTVTRNYGICLLSTVLCLV